MQAVCRFLSKKIRANIINSGRRTQWESANALAASELFSSVTAWILPFNTMSADGHKGPNATTAHYRLSVNLRYLRCLRVEYTSHAEPTDYTDILFSPHQSTEDRLRKILTRLQYVPFSTLKRTVWHCETVRFSVPNSPFRNAKRDVLLSPWVTVSYRADFSSIRFWNILTTIITPASSFPHRSKCAIHPLNLTIHSFVTQETPLGTRSADG